MEPFTHTTSLKPNSNPGERGPCTLFCGVSRTGQRTWRGEGWDQVVSRWLSQAKARPWKSGSLGWTDEGVVGNPVWGPRGCSSPRLWQMQPGTPHSQGLSLGEPFGQEFP